MEEDINPTDIKTYLLHLQTFVKKYEEEKNSPYFKGKADAYRYAAKKLNDVIQWSDPWAKVEEQGKELERLREGIKKYVHHMQRFFGEPKVGQPPSLQDLKELL